ncbi:hypothetical protein [Faecalicoccus pleomorphus]|uniref:hypothetical protein n=1 Tax=Faecalicoccus pleomorphus TaxID=1323 RepID=UPI0026EA1FED|nr:hypothetical protein [Faecalicoccus pleomorphus]
MDKEEVYGIQISNKDIVVISKCCMDQFVLERMDLMRSQKVMKRHVISLFLAILMTSAYLLIDYVKGSLGKAEMILIISILVIFLTVIGKKAYRFVERKGIYGYFSKEDIEKMNQILVRYPMDSRYVSVFIDHGIPYVFIDGKFHSIEISNHRNEVRVSRVFQFEKTEIKNQTIYQCKIINLVI